MKNARNCQLFHLLIAALLFATSLCSCTANSAPQEAKEALSKGQFARAEFSFRSESLHLENELRRLKTRRKGADSANNKDQLNEESKLAVRLAEANFGLGKALHLQGKYSSAIDCLQRSGDLYKLYMGKQNEFMVECLNLMAVSFFKQGKLLDAESAYKEELEIQKSLLKPDSLKLAATANNLAAIYQKLGEEDQAETHFKWALNLCLNCKNSGKESDQLADILTNFALFYLKQSELDKAREMIGKALFIELKHEGKTFVIDRVRSLLVLAAIEKTALEFYQAETHYQQALKLIDKELPERVDLSYETLEKLAELLLQEQKYEEALPVFQRALAACKLAHGDAHPEYAESLFEMALLFRRMQNDSRAEDCLRQALLIQEKTTGIDSSHYLATLHRLATVLSEQDKYAEASLLYEELLPKLKLRIGQMHPFLADTLDNWAGFAEQHGYKDRANELKDEAQLMRRKITRSLSSGYLSKEK